MMVSFFLALFYEATKLQRCFSSADRYFNNGRPLRCCPKHKKRAYGVYTFWMSFEHEK